MSRQKKVLFIIIDQLRADMLAGALAGHVDLPNLRALMGEATSFSRHYSAANPCGPSRASILTGQYAMNHRSVRNGTPLRHDTPNIATEVRKSGYLPLLFGYTDTSQDPRAWSEGDPALTKYEYPMQGFEEEVEMRLEESLPWRADLLAKGYDIPDYSEFYVPVAQEDGIFRPDDPAFYKAEDSDTAFLTNACLKSLSVRRGAPWFCHLTYIRPHPPLVAPAPYNKMYDPKALPLPARTTAADGEDAVHPFVAPARQSTNATTIVKGATDFTEDEESTQVLRSIYLGLATEVDKHIGRIISFLKQSGQYDDTLIVVTGDHGEMLGDHAQWGKSSFYDAAWHVPLIIRDPDRRGGAGQTVDLPTSAVDVTPTILNWLGRRVPDSMDGSSLLPFVAGETPETWRDYSYSELDFSDLIEPTTWQRALNLKTTEANLAILRGPRYTLVHFNAGFAPLLFDHDGKGELEDVAGRADMAPVLLEMTRKLLDHRMSFADRTLSSIQLTSDGPQTGNTA